MSNERKRIALVGLKGAGKDYIANTMFSEYTKISFAKKLKDVTSVLFDLPRDMLEGDTLASREWREQLDERLTSLFDKPITPRWLLQNIGTEVFREAFPGIWYKLLHIPEGRVIVTDCRFPDEMKFLKSKGFTIFHVYDGREPNFNDHPSEWSFTLFPVDGIINNFRD